MVVLAIIFIIVFLPEIVSGIVVGGLALLQVIGAIFGAIFDIFKYQSKSCARHEPVLMTMTALITGLIAFALWYIIWGRKGN